MEKPSWLDDEKELLKLLNNFIDRLDKASIEQEKSLKNIRISGKRFPELFKHNNKSDLEWNRLQQLSKIYKIFTLKLKKNISLFDSEFTGASITFNIDSESYLRQWLNRPKKIAYSVQWLNAVNIYAEHFYDAGEALMSRPVKIPGKTTEEVVHAFFQLRDLVNKDRSLRQLSAKCFWGASKFLDNKEEILHALFEHVTLRPRPVLVHIYIPKTIDTILFIENFDTYIQLIDQHFPESKNHLLVYIAGMRGTSKRIRNAPEVSFHLHASSEQSEFENISTWWISDIQNESPHPMYFWGDLDYSGLSILKKLRERFGNVRAWKPGYSLLVDLMNTGFGHEAILAGKENQKKLSSTGCDYADNTLLPVIKKWNRFIDQESV